MAKKPIETKGKVPWREYIRLRNPADRLQTCGREISEDINFLLASYRKSDKSEDEEEDEVWCMQRVYARADEAADMLRQMKSHHDWCIRADKAIQLLNDMKLMMAVEHPKPGHLLAHKQIVTE